MSIASDITLIRMKIGDYLKPAIDKDTGDGVIRDFVLTHKHIQDFIVEVDGSVKTETTDYAMDTVNGIITFVTPPALSKSVMCQYKFAGFTDTDFTTLLTTYTTVNYTVIEAIKMLLADAARRFDYVHGESQMNPSQVFDHLQKLLEIYKTSNTPTIMKRINPYYENDTKSNSTDLTRSDVGIDCEVLSDE